MPFLPATEEIITIRPGGPFSDASAPSSGANACVAMIGPITLTSIWRRKSSADSPSTGPADRDAGIVDEAGELFAVQRRAHVAGGRKHRGLVGDVEQQRREIGAELALEPVGIGLLADAAEDAKAAVEQQFGGGPADAGGRAGDDDGFHDWLPSGPPYVGMSARRRKGGLPAKWAPGRAAGPALMPRQIAAVIYRALREQRQHIVSLRLHKTAAL